MICQAKHHWNTGFIIIFFLIHVKKEINFFYFLFCREPGQGTTEEIRGRDFRTILETRESKAGGSSSKANVAAIIRREVNAKRQKFEIPAANLDLDDAVDGESDSDDSDDDDDNTAALLAELNKIKRERAQDSAKKTVEKQQEDERIRMENIVSGNPLLNYSQSQAAKADLKVKRRWDDDVVFKNCARTEPDKKNSQFINDSLRSEFHKKFMEKYIK